MQPLILNRFHRFREDDEAVNDARLLPPRGTQWAMVALADALHTFLIFAKEYSAGRTPDRSDELEERVRKLEHK